MIGTPASSIITQSFSTCVPRLRSELDGWAVVADLMMRDAAQRIVEVVEEPAGRAAVIATYSEELVSLSTLFALGRVRAGTERAQQSASASEAAALAPAAVASPSPSRREEMTTATSVAVAHERGMTIDPLRELEAEAGTAGGDTQQSTLSSFSDLKAELTSQLSHLASACAEREERLNALQGLVDRKEADYDELSTALTDLDTVQRALSEEVATLRAARVEGRSALEDIENRLEELYNRLATLTDRTGDRLAGSADGPLTRRKGENDVDGLLDGLSRYMEWLLDERAASEEERCQQRTHVQQHINGNQHPATGGQCSNPARDAAGEECVRGRCAAPHYHDESPSPVPVPANEQPRSRPQVPSTSPDRLPYYETDEEDVLRVATPLPTYKRVVPSPVVNTVTATLLQVQAQVRNLREPSLGPMATAMAKHPRLPQRSSSARPQGDTIRTGGDEDDVCTPRPTLPATAADHSSRYLPTGYISRALYQQYGTSRRPSHSLSAATVVQHHHSQDGSVLVAGGAAVAATRGGGVAWRERMEELQGELRSLRRDLGGS